MNILKQLLAIFTNQKDFSGIIGHPLANRLGLHLVRILLSDAVCHIRTLPFRFLERDTRKVFARDGVVVIENFLGQDPFRQVRDEVRQRLAELPPAPENSETGFGNKIPHPLGFDRYDGGTLNRFAEIGRDTATNRFLLSNPRLARLTLALFGLFNRPAKYAIYELRHGDENANPDIQKQTHKDTFHHTFKLWYFVEDVDAQQGPFAYSLGSHRSGRDTLAWEYQMSLAASHGHPNQGGSFRATDADLEQMHLPGPQPFQVPANSLVIADTRGFHRRCEGEEGSRRIGIYANFRPLAFLPFPI